MMQFAVIKTGGQQFLVKKGEEIFVQRIDGEPKEKIKFEVLTRFDSEKGDIELGEPFCKSKAEGSILEQVKGEKIRIAKFKSKVRYRRVKGYRAKLSKIRIEKI